MKSKLFHHHHHTYIVKEHKMSSGDHNGNEALPIEIHFKNELVIKTDENNNNIGSGTNTTSSKHHHHVEEWGYDKENGPSEWGKRYPRAFGKHQSPIDIDTGAALFNEKLLEQPLEFSFAKDCFHELKNTGHSFNVVPLPHATSRVIGGPVSQEHHFLQFHMHWGTTDETGSEHLVDGKFYSAELHFVNWNSTKYRDPSEAVKSNSHDGLIVLGVLIKIGAHNLEFDKIIPSLQDINLKDKKTTMRHSLDYTKLFPADTSSYWTYEGSLTTPPCTECVQWVVFKEPIEISHNQLKAFHRLYRCTSEASCCDSTKMVTNYRPVCDLNGRPVYKSFK